MAEAAQTAGRQMVGLTFDELDELSEHVTQLAAMLNLSYGNCGESFREMSDGIQDAFLWACASKAQRIETLADKIRWARDEAGARNA